MAKYLVTGGAGFIGSHIARRLLELGHKVVIADNLLTGYRHNLPEKAEFIKLDISKPDDYKKLSRHKFDAIFHLAAQSSGEISDEKPELDLFTNAYGTFLLLQWAKKQGIKRFLYASSMAVYGNVDKLPVMEKQRCEPLSFYGITKLAGENYVRHFGRKGINITAFRLFSVYGPGQDMSNMKQGMVSIYLAYLLNKKSIWVKGSKDRFRDFTYIDDVVDVWIKSINNRKTFGKIYNLATGKKTYIRQLVNEEIKVFGYKKYRVVYKGSTPADQFGLYADVSKITKELNWHPRHSLSHGLKQMVQWVKQGNL